jgi:hypothetical protein
MPSPATNTAYGPGGSVTAHPGNMASDPEQTDLETLGTALGLLGCKTILTTGQGRQPCLDVLNPQARTSSTRIRAQADYFWWPTAEPIALRSEILAAASHIADALGVIHACTRATGGSHPHDSTA